jgi:hypothetical protein
MYERCSLLTNQLLASERSRDLGVYRLDSFMHGVHEWL